MKLKIITSLLCFSFLFSCKEKNKKKIEASIEKKEIISTKKIANAIIIGKSGKNTAGKVTFTEINGKVSMVADIDSIGKQGNHAIHIHAVGDCSAEDGKSAGGHWNPTNVNHGKWGENPFHVGDIGNLEINNYGIGAITRTTDLWCVGCGDPKKDVVGKAIIIHEGPDDFSSQPSGAAGPRIGCGEIVIVQ